MKHKIWRLSAFFICCWLVFVARHHPPSRRKIKEIWHGRVFWESNTTRETSTMLRSSVRVNNTAVDTAVDTTTDTVTVDTVADTVADTAADTVADTVVDAAADTTDTAADTFIKREMQVMVSVLSRRSAFETRQVIRETWASGHNNVFFAVGVCCPIPPNDRLTWRCKRAKSTSVEEQSKWDMECAKQDLKIAEEEAKYKDIIRMPDIDVYRHLPQKVKFSYKWGLEHTTAKWFVKTDDDSVVRIDTLGSYLQKTYNSDEYVVVGRIANGWGVPRSGKWAENNYKPSKYPKFPLGSVGHVVSKGVATYIVDNSDKLFNYQGEDVSIGIWLNESPLKSEVKWVTSKHMANHGNCKDTGMWVMGHNIKPAKMRECFAHKDEIQEIVKLPSNSLKSTDKLKRTERYVYDCGYIKTPHSYNPNSDAFRKALFADFKYNPNRPPTSNDVLLASGRCSFDFKGTIIFFASEGGQLLVTNNPSVIYVGPSPNKNYEKTNNVKIKAKITSFHGAWNLIRGDWKEQIKRLQTRQPLSGNRFLAYIYGNCRRKEREDIYNSIIDLCQKNNLPLPSAYAKCHGNHPETYVSDPDAVGYTTELRTQAVMSKHKFVLAVEGKRGVDFLHSEKLINAFASGSIPIYSGPKTVFKIFRPESFIYLDIKNPQQALDTLMHLATDVNAYNAMRAEPMLQPGAIDTYFSFGADIGDGSLRSAIRKAVGIEIPLTCKITEQDFPAFRSSGHFPIMDPRTSDLNLLESNAVMVDIGCFQSKHLIHYAKLGFDVYCFEPMKSNFNKISKEVSIYPNIKIMNVGIAKNSGIACLNKDNSDGATVIQNKECPEALQIDLVTIVEAFNMVPKTIGVLQINCEGCEDAIMTSILNENIDMSGIDILGMQIHLFEKKSEQLYCDFQKYMEKTHTIRWKYDRIWTQWKKHPIKKKKSVEIHMNSDEYIINIHNEITTAVAKSISTDVSNHLASSYGPCEYDIHIDGPALISPYVTKYSHGVSTATFQVPISGNYTVRIIKLRDNYDAVNELSKKHPSLIYDILLHKQYTFTKTKKQVPSWLQINTAAKRQIPIQIGSDIAKKDYNDVALDNNECGKSVDYYKWSESPRPFGSDLKITFVGDSQTRTLFNAFLMEFCLFSESAKKELWGPQHISVNTPRCVNATFVYEKNVDCSYMNFKPGITYVTNCGQWAHQESIKQYVDKVSKFAKLASDYDVLWLETLYHQRDDKWVHSWPDRNTAQRIHAMNTLVAGYWNRIVKAFDSTHALSGKLCDIMHYTAKGAMTPQITQIINLINPLQKTDQRPVDNPTQDFLNSWVNVKENSFINKKGQKLTDVDIEEPVTIILMGDSKERMLLEAIAKDEQFTCSESTPTGLNIMKHDPTLVVNGPNAEQPLEIRKCIKKNIQVIQTFVSWGLEPYGMVHWYNMRIPGIDGLVDGLSNIRGFSDRLIHIWKTAFPDFNTLSQQVGKNILVVWDVNTWHVASMNLKHGGFFKPEQITPEYRKQLQKNATKTIEAFTKLSNNNNVKHVVQLVDETYTMRQTFMGVPQGQVEHIKAINNAWRKAAGKYLLYNTNLQTFEGYLRPDNSHIHPTDAVLRQWWYIYKHVSNMEFRSTFKNKASIVLEVRKISPNHLLGGVGLAGNLYQLASMLLATTQTVYVDASVVPTAFGSIMCTQENPFNFMFKQHWPAKKVSIHSLHSRSIGGSPVNAFPYSAYIPDMETDQKKIELFRKRFRNNFHLTKYITDMFEKKWLSVQADKCRVPLGVHIRSTDLKLLTSFVTNTEETSVRMIRHIHRLHPSIDCIFLASDSEYSIQHIEKAFKGELKVVYLAAFRETSNIDPKKIWITSDYDSVRSCHMRKKAEEAMMEIMFLQNATYFLREPTASISKMAILFKNFKAVYSNKDLPTKTNKKYVKLTHTSRNAPISGNIGLGNHMFQYASTLGIAHERNAIACGDVHSQLKTIFKGPWIKPCPKNVKFIPVVERGFGLYDENLVTNGAPSISVGTYLQSWKYFKNINDNIRRIFAFKDKFSPDSWISEHRKNDTTLVAMHLRFGDHVKYKYIRLPPQVWYTKIYQRFNTKTTIVVFSDDLEKAMAYLPNPPSHINLIRSPNISPAHDMALMSVCDEILSSRGTFSWWPIWLKGHGISYINEFDHTNPIVTNKIKNDDYYLPDTLII